METIIRDFPLSINEKSVLGFMGYPRRGDALSGPRANRSLDQVRHLMKKYGELIKPQGIYAFFSFSCRDDELQLVDFNECFMSSFLAERFRRAHHVGFFVATIGDALEKEVRLLTEAGSISEGFMLDAIGSAAAESTARHIHLRIQSESACRMVRYSPGFDHPGSGFDWPLADQEKIFRLLDPGRIGVSLTPSWMMKPRKSVSAIIGAR
jgi:cobalamin-dependent methionine synthase I